MNDQCYYRLSVKALAVDTDGRFLLLREDNGKWELPGGGLDHGEDPMKCLEREVFEETGLEITYVSPKPTYFVTSPRLGQPTYTANIIYEVQFKNLDFTPSDECQEAKYFTVEEALKIDKFPNIDAFLKVYNPELHQKTS